MHKLFTQHGCELHSFWLQSYALQALFLILQIWRGFEIMD